ncbi:MAG TPA: tyrosine-type recombinase/integrase [Actinospica sp.]|jgi:integrase|nr:tyrosine-type recombinase/integrase [Actinospica sp.]
MGWPRTWTTKQGKTRYQALYRDAKGNEQSAGVFDSLEKAKKAWEKAEAKVGLGRAVDVRRGRKRFRAYVLQEWFPKHRIELSTRESYDYTLHALVLPEFGKMRMMDILPSDVREWITKMEAEGVPVHSIRKAKVVIDAIFKTALNELVVGLHPGHGVEPPVAAVKTKLIVTPEQFDAVYAALDHEMYRLLVETDIESGLRWGELTELRGRDINLATGMLTVSRAVVQLNPKIHPEGKRFYVKAYPKDRKHRALKLPEHLVKKIERYVTENGIGKDDLLFHFVPLPRKVGLLPTDLPNPETLGWTEPNANRRTYQHGTPSAYGKGRCRCQHCRNAVTAYRNQRRAEGKDRAAKGRPVDTDGHISSDWFRANVWYKAIERSGIDVHVTPHGMRHAHASWLLAGGADIQVVKARLGHGSIITTQGYLHTLPTADESALNALDTIRGVRTASTTPVDSSGETITVSAQEWAAMQGAQLKLAEMKKLFA